MYLARYISFTLAIAVTTCAIGIASTMAVVVDAFDGRQRAE